MKRKKLLFTPYWTGSGYAIYSQNGKIAFIKPKDYDLLSILNAFQKAQNLADKLAQKHYNTLLAKI